MRVHANPDPGLQKQSCLVSLPDEKIEKTKLHWKTRISEMVPARYGRGSRRFLFPSPSVLVSNHRSLAHTLASGKINIRFQRYHKTAAFYNQLCDLVVMSHFDCDWSVCPLIGNNTQPKTAIKPVDCCQYPLIRSPWAVFTMSADTGSDLKPLNAKSTGYDITWLCKPGCTDKPASSIWNKKNEFKNQTEWCNISLGDSL